MTLVTLVIGSRPADREAEIAAAISAQSDLHGNIAVIAEGLPLGNSPLDALEQQAGADMSLSRIAPGCPCCIGNLSMQVTLNRMLRCSPAHLYISLASSLHLEQIRAFLTRPPYQELLTLTNDWHV